MKETKQDSFRYKSQLQERLYNYSGQPSKHLQNKIRYYITPYNRRFRKRYMNFDVVEDELDPTNIDCSITQTITQLQANRNWRIISDFILNQQRQGLSIKPTTFVKDKKKKVNFKWFENNEENDNWREKSNTASRVLGDVWALRCSRISADGPHSKLLFTNFGSYPLVSRNRSCTRRRNRKAMYQMFKFNSFNMFFKKIKEVICYNDMYCFIRKLKNHNHDAIPIKKKEHKSKQKQNHLKRAIAEWNVNQYKKRLTRHDICKSIIKDHSDLIPIDSKIDKEDRIKSPLSPVPTLKQWIEKEK